MSTPQRMMMAAALVAALATFLDARTSMAAEGDKGRERTVSVSAIGSVAAEPDMAQLALVEMRGAARLHFGGVLADGRTLALMQTPDAAQALAWFAETGSWRADTLTARPLLHVL